jgi:hypothetical protein
MTEKKLKQAQDLKLSILHTEFAIETIKAFELSFGGKKPFNHLNFDEELQRFIQDLKDKEIAILEKDIEREKKKFAEL